MTSIKGRNSVIDLRKIAQNDPSSTLSISKYISNLESKFRNKSRVVIKYAKNDAYITIKT